jgi:hypothetical protein
LEGKGAPAPKLSPPIAIWHKVKDTFSTAYRVEERQQLHRPRRPATLDINDAGQAVGDSGNSLAIPESLHMGDAADRFAGLGFAGFRRALRTA